MNLKYLENNDYEDYKAHTNYDSDYDSGSEFDDDNKTYCSISESDNEDTESKTTINNDLSEESSDNDETYVDLNDFQNKCNVKKEEEDDNYHIWVSRSQPRDPENGAISFDISFDVGTEKESWSRINIIQLMDLETNTFYYKEVADAINDWIEVAKNTPNNRRDCLCCKNRTIKGSVLCKKCDEIYREIIYC